MKNRLYNTYFNFKNRVNNFKNNFLSDERGVSPIVATVLIILITVVLALLVSDTLRDWVKGILDKFINKSNKI